MCSKWIIPLQLGVLKKTSLHVLREFYNLLFMFMQKGSTLNTQRPTQYAPIPPSDSLHPPHIILSLTHVPRWLVLDLQPPPLQGRLSCVQEDPWSQDQLDLLTHEEVIHAPHPGCAWRIKPKVHTSICSLSRLAGVRPRLMTSSIERSHSFTSPDEVVAPITWYPIVQESLIKTHKKPQTSLNTQLHESADPDLTCLHVEANEQVGGRRISVRRAGNQTCSEGTLIGERRFHDRVTVVQL